MSEVPHDWIRYCAEVLYDLHRAGILDQLDEMTDDEIDKRLDQLPRIDYHTDVLQTPRVAPEQPTSYAGLESASLT